MDKIGQVAQWRTFYAIWDSCVSDEQCGYIRQGCVIHRRNGMREGDQ